MQRFFRTFICFLVVTGGSLFAEEPGDFVEEPDKPLFEKMPFDRITTTPKFNRATYDVLPITFAAGARPNPLPRSEFLVVRMLNMPLKELRIFWVDIERIDLFFELVEQEFVRRLDALAKDVQNLSPETNDWKNLAERFELMFEYLRYLEPHRDELPNLTKSEQKFLFEEGTYRMRSKDYRTGSARFERLYGRDGKNKDYPGLEKNWADALATLMEEEFLSGNEAAGRRYLERFRAFYPDNSTVESWEKRLRIATVQRCNLSKRAFEKKEYLSAHRYFGEAWEITPGLPELQEWKQRLFADAPRLDIAVGSPLRRQTEASLADLPDWATRRGRPLLTRMLSEFRQPSLQGGIYASPLGILEKSDKNRTLRWTFPENRRNEFRLSLYDVAETILFFSAPSESNRGESGRSRSTPLDNLVETVTVTAPDRIELRLRRGHLIPESLFTLPIIDSTRFATPGVHDDESHGNQDPARDGLFVWKHQEERITGFEINHRRRLEADTVGPPKVLFEHTVLRGEEAVELLQAGKVDMIDRLPPWELEKFRDDRNYVTGRYAMPTVHFLVPNMRRPLTASRTFRRALLYGLNRDAMLGKILEKGGQGEVVSVPFIKGASLDDPLGYGYDNSIRPRPYEPKLAIALSLLAFDQVRNREPGWEELAEMPPLVLSRPKHDMAEYIALMIRRQWEALGVPVQVVDYRENEAIGQGEDVDFWLVDRVVAEPLVDARRIFGHGGLLRQPSSYMELALEKLHLAEDWPTAGKCLHEIHRLCFEETTVLPLWQLTDHYVHRIGIDGIRTDEGVVELYRNLLRWTVLFH